MKLTKKTKLSELLEKYPEANEILLGQGLHCMGCPFIVDETLEQAAMGHGISPGKFIKQLTEKLKR